MAVNEAKLKKALAKIAGQLELEKDEGLTKADVKEAKERGKEVTVILTDFRKFKVEV